MEKDRAPQEHEHDAADTDRRRKKRSPWPGGIIILILVLLTAAFLAMLYTTRLVPAKYLVFLGLALLLLITVIGLLVQDFKKRGSFWTGTAFAAIAAFLLISGLIAGRQVLSAFNSITTPGIELTQIGVLVAAEDPAQELGDLSGYTFGILAALDRPSVDSALTDISGRLGEQLLVMEFSGLTDAVDALFNGQTGALVMNLAYLDIFEEMEGYETVASRLREIARIGIETRPVSSGSSTNDPAESGIFTVYLSGIDSRSGMAAKSRSDVNILATVNTNTHQILLVSTPRDFYVPLSISNGQLDKLTHAGIYGIDVSMDTIGMLYDIDVDYYFKVSFTGFEKIIDSLGGVTVYSDYSFTSVEGDSYSKGENTLNGSQALAFARERMAFAAGDRQRGRNQMAVIKGVINKLMSVEVLKNYSSLLHAVEGSFETSVPYDLIAQLVRDQLSSGDGWNVVTYSVDGSGSSQRTYSQGYKAYVMIPNQETVDTAKALMQQVRDGEIVQAP